MSRQRRLKRFWANRSPFGLSGDMRQEWLLFFGFVSFQFAQVMEGVLLDTF